MNAPFEPGTTPRGAFYQSVLAPHPSTPCEAVRSIEVRLARTSDAGLDLAYTVEGDPSRVCLPRPASPRRADGLWRHTCFEAFIAPDPGTAYLELNFSPSGEWACYAFGRYREGMVAEEGVAAVITVSGIEPLASSRGAATASRADPRPGSERPWVIRAAVRFARTARLAAAARVALAAVIEESDGRLSYWALRHPPGKPDFHHQDGFALRL